MTALHFTQNIFSIPLRFFTHSIIEYFLAFSYKIAVAKIALFQCLAGARDREKCHVSKDMSHSQNCNWLRLTGLE